MNEQQQHLETALNQQKELISEIQELNSTLAIKKEQFLKLQGIIEYLNSLGVEKTQEVPEVQIDE
jgi:cbb3-type cytochrome oxidase cytochrome c subunit